jgi:YgiT-type zinc finger domain-containing protein
MGARFQEKKIMRCLICKQADTQPGRTTVTLEREQLTLVIKDVPARVCPNCGEDYVEEAIASRLLDTLNQASQAGVQVDIRHYQAA